MDMLLFKLIVYIHVQMSICYGWSESSLVLLDKDSLDRSFLIQKQNNKIYYAILNIQHSTQRSLQQQFNNNEHFYPISSSSINNNLLQNFNKRTTEGRHIQSSNSEKYIYKEAPLSSSFLPLSNKYIPVSNVLTRAELRRETYVPVVASSIQSTNEFNNDKISLNAAQSELKSNILRHQPNNLVDQDISELNYTPIKNKSFNNFVDDSHVLEQKSAVSNRTTIDDTNPTVDDTYNWDINSNHMINLYQNEYGRLDNSNNFLGTFDTAPLITTFAHQDITDLETFPSSHYVTETLVDNAYILHNHYGLPVSEKMDYPILISTDVVYDNPFKIDFMYPNLGINELSSTMNMSAIKQYYEWYQDQYNRYMDTFPNPIQHELSFQNRTPYSVTDVPSDKTNGVYSQSSTVNKFYEPNISRVVNVTSETLTHFNNSEDQVIKTQVLLPKKKQSSSSFIRPISDVQKTGDNHLITKTTKNDNSLHQRHTQRYKEKKTIMLLPLPMTVQEACQSVLVYGYHPSHLCCTVSNGGWSNVNTWDCKRVPNRWDIAVILHHIELFDHDADITIGVHALFIVSSIEHKARLRAGLPLWSMCRTHLINGGKQKLIRSNYRYPWKSINSTINQLFEDLLGTQSNLKVICKELLGNYNAFNYSGNIYIGSSVQRQHPSQRSLSYIGSTHYPSKLYSSPKHLTQHHGTTEIQFLLNPLTNHSSNDRFTINQRYSKRDLQSIDGRTVPIVKENHFSKKLLNFERELRNKTQGPVGLFVGPTAGLLLFDGVSVIIHTKGLIENNGTFFIGQKVKKHCLKNNTQHDSSMRECIDPSVSIQSGVSLKAWKPIHIFQLEVLGNAQSLPEKSDITLEWRGFIGYYPNLPDSEKSTLIINQGHYSINFILSDFIFSYKTLELRFPDTQYTQKNSNMISFSFLKNELSASALTFCIDTISTFPKNKHYILNIRSIGIKFYQYLTSEIYVEKGTQLSIISHRILMDRHIKHNNQEVSSNNKNLTQLNFICKQQCEINNRLYRAIGTKYIELYNTLQ